MISRLPPAFFLISCSSSAASSFSSDGELAVLQLGDLVEVVLALGFFDCEPGLFDLGFDFCEFFESAGFGLPLGLQGRALVLGFREFLLEFLQTIARRLIGLTLEGLALDFQLHHAPIDLVDLDRHRFLLGAQLGCRFIDQVDRLVGQESIGDVTLGEHRGVTSAESLIRIP